MLVEVLLMILVLGDVLRNWKQKQTIDDVMVCCPLKLRIRPSMGDISGHHTAQVFTNINQSNCKSDVTGECVL